ncbi:MAG: glycosyltransferase [Sphingobacteriales bacterium]
MKPLNLFYSEPQADRWIKFDRYPRMIIRRLLRGKPRPGGVMMVAINLMKGLDKIGVDYRFNDYVYIKNHPDELACIIGKPHLLFKKKWRNPILFGAGVFSHPSDCPDLFAKYPNVQRILVPGEWMRKMFEPFYRDKVISWPVGIDTDYWRPQAGEKQFDFLIYDKIRWEHDQFQTELIDPIVELLEQRDLSYRFIKYGNYTPSQLKTKLGQSRAVIFLCEHETQGLAYQQILATDTPILAWNRGGYWQDTEYYPHRVRYDPVTSVPYWDDRCGRTFTGADDFNLALELFTGTRAKNAYSPRAYILENLTLEKCASEYVNIVRSLNGE